MSNNSLPDVKTLERSLNEVEIITASVGAVLSFVNIALLLTYNGKLKTRLKLLLSLLICDFMLAVLHIIRPFSYFDSIWFTDSLDYDVTTKQMERYLLQSFDIQDFFELLCSDLYFIAQISALVTMLTLAFDILILVKYPLQYEEMMSQRRGNILLLCSWSGSITFVLIFRLLVELDWFRVIDVTWSSSPMKGYVHYVYGGFQALSNVCFLVFIIVYLVIYVEIRKLVARLPSGEARGSVKAAVTMVIILLAYVVCMMPASWVVLAGIITGNSRLFRKLIVISRILYVANSVCDPLIYAIRIPEVRQRYKILFCKKESEGATTSITTIATNAT